MPVQDDMHLLNSLSASNQTSLDHDDEMARDARRLVEQTFRFAANDCKGNMSGQIKCDICRFGWSVWAGLPSMAVVVVVWYPGGVCVASWTDFIGVDAMVWESKKIERSRRR